MIYEFLSNQISISTQETDTYESNIEFKLKFVEELFTSSVAGWPEKQRNTMRFQVDSGDSVSPVVRAFPGGSYRIIFPVKMVFELESIIFGKEVQSHEKDSFETRIVLIALILCLYHELLHCLRGHLDEDLSSSKSEETDADFMAGGSLWGCINNQSSLLAQHGFGDVQQTAYEIGYASTILCVLFQKYHSEGDGYHLPHQRLLTLIAGYMNPILQKHGDYAALIVGRLQESGINDAKEFLKTSEYSVYVDKLFDNESNQKDYFEVIGETQKKRDKDIDIWHRASFLLEPIRHLLSKNK
ncbi:hypothetical protein [Oceanimonas smirnovii]|uniref:Peptidase M48 domain-containing protein n=1 Tax=Oceanimonas smirnovii TaxID=264574 RepID=A0ABW7P560_9GAMM